MVEDGAWVHEPMDSTNGELLNKRGVLRKGRRENISREDFYLKMLGLVDGSRDVDLCGVEGGHKQS